MEGPPESHAPPTGPESATPDSLESEWTRLLADAGLAEAQDLPPAVLATPHEVHRTVGRDVAWWRPSWRDGWQFVGWRWVFLLPTVLLIVSLFPPFNRLLAPLLAVGLKLAVFMIAVALTLAGYVFRRAARARTEPFCIFCGYNLTGLPDHYRCPECGRPYTWRLIAEYRRDPQWFIERYRALRSLPPSDKPFTAGPRRRRSRDGT
jgi:hypothetical protein